MAPRSSAATRKDSSANMASVQPDVASATQVPDLQTQRVQLSTDVAKLLQDDDDQARQAESLEGQADRMLLQQDVLESSLKQQDLQPDQRSALMNAMDARKKGLQASKRAAQVIRKTTNTITVIMDLVLPAGGMTQSTVVPIEQTAARNSDQVLAATGEKRSHDTAFDGVRNDATFGPQQAQQQTAQLFNTTPNQPLPAHQHHSGPATPLGMGRSYTMASNDLAQAASPSSATSVNPALAPTHVQPMSYGPPVGPPLQRGEQQQPQHLPPPRPRLRLWNRRPLSQNSNPLPPALPSHPQLGSRSFSRNGHSGSEEV